MKPKGYTPHWLGYAERVLKMEKEVDFSKVASVIHLVMDFLILAALINLR